jgi:AraC-like DNA-binding protein
VEVFVPACITCHDWTDDMPRHRHLQRYAAIVLSGGYVEAGDAGRMRVRAGDVLVHDEHEAHRNEFSRAGAVVLNLPVCTGDLPRMAHCHDVDLLVRVAERDPREAGVALSTVITSTSTCLDDWPDLLARQMLADPDLRLRRWAADHGLAPQSVSRGFKLAYGVSPQRFRLEARARRALRHLRASGGTLAALAADHGFSDHAHLSRTVASMTGLTPTALRARRAKGDFSAE